MIRAPVIGLVCHNTLASRAAEKPKHVLHSQYAGQESRAVKSLSAQDIAALESGSGWGLAKAAELNGLPGPVHLLQMKAEIPLDRAQAAPQLTLIYSPDSESLLTTGPAKKYNPL